MENLRILIISKRQICYLLLVNILLILLALLVINYSDMDVKIQNLFFDFEAKKWLIDKNEPIRKMIFYKAPKLLFAGLIVVSLIFTVVGFLKKNQFCFLNRHKFLLLFLGVAFIPLFAGNIKKFTNVYCPDRLQIYGGDAPYIKIFDSYPENFHQVKKAQCFPAGHVVTGFSLFILFFVFESVFLRYFSLLLAFFFGWTLGFYQMAKGVHFFGDTVVSMLVCFLLATLLYILFMKFLQKRIKIIT